MLPEIGSITSFAQQRMWFMVQLVPGNPFYNVPVAYRLQGPLDLPALGQALHEIVTRHQALRTRFVAVNGAARQIVDPPSAVLSDVEDVASLAEARRIAEQEALRSFDLATGPLLRARLLRVDAENHVLLITMHHIVTDHLSLRIFADELGTLYQAFTAEQPAPLQPLPIQYVDYARWQRSWMSGPVLEQQLHYWREQLADLPHALQLPTDRPRPPAPSYAAGDLSFQVPAHVVQKLRALGRRRGATLFVALLAAFDMLLARYAATTDVAVGVPIAGRTGEEVEGLIGFFVNTLVLRVDCSGDPTFAEVLRQVRETWLDAYDHQDLPFERLVEELQPQRDLSRNPFVQIGFQVLPGAERIPQLSGLQTSVFGGRDATTRLDLEMNCTESDDGLSCYLVYAAELFDAATMQRFADHFVRLLEQVVHDPGLSLSRLELLTPAERDRQLVAWNDTDAPLAHRCVVAAFEAHAAATPHAPAVTGGGRSLDYGELNARANRLAHRLRALGAGPETLVGLWAERGTDAVIGVLGIVKVGAAYLPLDPTYPADRLEYILADSACSLLVVQKGLVPPAVGDAQVIDLDSDADPAEDPGAPGIAVHEDNLAYVIYTSGSTGQPKGVAVTHRGLANMAAQATGFGIGPGSRVLQYASLCFDASVLEMWFTWFAGAELVIATGLIGDELGEELAASAITHALLVPSVLGTVPHRALPHLQTLFIGAEAATPELVNRWAPGRRLVNLYGPTEGTVNVTAQLCPDHVSATPPIGTPIANTQVYLLDAGLAPVPVGVPGEIYAAGAGLTRGYTGKPALTATRLVANPYGPPGSRLYRTGDLGRYLPDGSIEFLGRSDNQVKLNGLRIELGEVESVLAAHPHVRQSAVTVCEGPSGQRRLVAYIVPERADDDEHAEAHLRDCRQEFDKRHREGLPWPPHEHTSALAQRILAHQPARVLEIGCGEGLLLRQLLAEDRRYTATDFAIAAVDRLRFAPDLVGRENLTVAVREASDFTGLADRSFDTVVLDSVVGHFPNTAHLEKVLTGAMALVDDDGLLALGDLAAPDTADPDELAVALDYFTSHLARSPRVADVEVIAAGSQRYHVLLRTRAGADTAAAPVPEGMATDPLRRRQERTYVAELRRHARERLPDYMIPSSFTVMDGLPLSPSGKIDQRALPDPEPVMATVSEAPRSPRQKFLCELFAEALGRDVVGVDDNFFELGGHSLLAIRLVNQIRAAMGVRLSLRELFLWPTPAGLAEHFDAANGGQA
ncbi:amino acid adenylation domain-containing protein [Nonomuraea sp. NPDC046570]|uniref:non-ribosomal peptide synthetase n=1 Tax=Nonomuraea sp. NPDC046570 TaxID=3155255 RepID=UPI0033C4F608